MVLANKLPRRANNNIIFIGKAVTGEIYKHGSSTLYTKLETDNLCIAYRNLIKRHARQGKPERSIKTIIMDVGCYHSNSVIAWDSERYRNQLQLAGQMLGTVKNQSVLLFAERDTTLTLLRMFGSVPTLQFQPTTLGMIINQSTGSAYFADTITIPSVRTLVVLVTYRDIINIERVIEKWLNICTRVENVYIYIAFDTYQGEFHGSSIVQGNLEIPEHPTLKNITISARHHIIHNYKSRNGDKVCLTVHDRNFYEPQYTVTGFLSDLQNYSYVSMYKKQLQPELSVSNFKTEVIDMFYSHFGYSLQQFLLWHAR
jgi:hypothetical protein